jgi:hypothetical protein
MNPDTAMTLVEQRREELTRNTAQSRRAGEAGGRWLSRHLPHWHLSWSRTVLSPTAGPDANGYPDRAVRRGSSLVIIISAHR